MKKSIAVLTLLAVILSGCASFQESKTFTIHKDGSQAQHVLAQTCGLYFLPGDTFPLWTGDEKQVDLATTTETIISKASGSKVTDLTTSTTSSWLPFTFVLWYKTSATSATYVK